MKLQNQFKKITLFYSVDLDTFIRLITLYFGLCDEDSEYETLKSNIIAGLNVSLSGNPFWGWDIAGFSGDLPEPDLYNRSCELAVFTPIFQFHSEHPGDPVPSAERSPWNMADYYKNNQIIDNYRFYASLRMNLSPYIFKKLKPVLRSVVL